MDDGGSGRALTSGWRKWTLAAAIAGVFTLVLISFTSVMSGSWVNMPMALVFGAGGVHQWVRYRQSR
ncbi:hypothetical protein [Amycolatopsis sp. NPDC051061]|uniref:hypothetical protein n=1 Tax=Amycolatopsis sp. NPDC051061 TaxID=3155042 RepID=UPI003419AC04